MPFGLTIAPTTFQALMNSILRPNLRCFVLFFDDILIYGDSWLEHLRHVLAALRLQRLHKLFLKKSKCNFREKKVAYLGYLISEADVAMDDTKVQAVRTWPEPRPVRALRGFLGLAGYYCKFIQGFGSIAEPHVSIRKRHSPGWRRPPMLSRRCEATAGSELAELRSQIEDGSLHAPWSVVDGLVLYNNRVHVH